MKPEKSKRGGYRPGAGRKPAPKVTLKIAAPDFETAQIQSDAPADIPPPLVDVLSHKDPKVFLLALMNDPGADVKLRADAAKSLMPFMHLKLGEGGKKDQKQTEAQKAASGKFSAAAPPKLVAAGGRKV
jgi:phage terminase small subunit